MSVESSSEWQVATGPVLSPELRAVLACARTVVDAEQLDSLRAALALCLSPERLCEVAIAHGMLGHLHRVVTSAPSVSASLELARRLAGLQRINAERSLRQTGRLLRILDRLDSSGVKAMPIKGPLWAQCLYGDITLRSWSDLDLLVVHDQVAAAREVLLADGFVDSNPFNVRISRRKLGGLGQIALSAADGSVHVEVHWEATVGMSPRSLRPESVFTRAESASLLGRQVFCPGKTDFFLITCLNGTRDRWNSVEKLLGLAVQVRDTHAEAWPDLLSAGRAAGCSRRVILAVGHACRTLGLETPPAIQAAMAVDSVARGLLRSLKPDELQKGSALGPRRELARLFWGFATEDRFLLGLEHAATRFFRPGPEDWNAFALPRGTQWLYYTLRPVRVVGKWVGSLFRTRRGSNGATTGL
jgi:hypothetical protein